MFPMSNWNYLPGVRHFWVRNTKLRLIFELPPSSQILGTQLKNVENMVIWSCLNMGIAPIFFFFRVNMMRNHWI